MKFFFFYIFAIHSSSRHEKHCQMSLRLFSLFRGSIYQQWYVSRCVWIHIVYVIHICIRIYVGSEFHWWSALYNNSNFEFIIFQYRFNSYFKNIMTSLCITTIQSNFTARVHFKTVVAVYLIREVLSDLIQIGWKGKNFFCKTIKNLKIVLNFDSFYKPRFILQRGL